MRLLVMLCDDVGMLEHVLQLSNCREGTGAQVPMLISGELVFPDEATP